MSAPFNLSLLAEGELYDTFVEPFADVVSAAKIGAQDIANSAGLVLTLANPLLVSPKKVKEKVDAHRQRAESINRKWEELNTKIKSDLSPDVKAVAFLANPSAFLAAAATKGALSTGKSVLFDATGLGDWIGDKVGLMRSKLDQESGSGRSGGSSRPSDKSNDTSLDKLARLFFLTESKSKSLLEDSKDDDKPQGTENDAFQVLDRELEKAGLSDALQKEFDEYYTSLEEAVEQFVNDFGARGRALQLLQDAKSSKDLERALSILVKEKQVSQSDANKAIEQIKETAQKLLADEGFRSKAAGSSSLEEDPEQLAFETAFGLVRQQIEESLEEAHQGLKEIADEILEGVPSEKELESIGGKNASKLLQLVKKVKEVV
jgi:hypothetical protein